MTSETENNANTKHGKWFKMKMSIKVLIDTGMTSETSIQTDSPFNSMSLDTVAEILQTFLTVFLKKLRI